MPTRFSSLLFRSVGPIALALSGSGLSAQSADPGLPAYHPGSPVAGSVAAVSADTMEGLIRAWAAAFRSYQPGADITETMKDVGPEDRAALGPDTAEVFRNDNEPYEDAYGYEPFRICVSMAAFNRKEHIQAIAVFVNRANPLGQVSLAELDAIYSRDRRRGYPAAITTWGQLGLTGEWAERPIHAYGRGIRKDEVGMYFRDVVMFDGLYQDGFRVPGRGVSADVVKAVTGDPAGIGFCAFSYVSADLRPLALADAHGVVGQPVLGDVASGRYPLDRPLYLYVNRKPGRPLDPLLKEFLRFVLSKEGQDVVAASTYLPLSPEIAAAERAKLE